MKNSILKICNDAVRQYKQDKNVLGVMLFGSAAKNKFDQYSDVDIYIVLEKKGKYFRRNYIKNGVRVDIIFNTLKEAQDYLKEDKNNIRRIASNMLACGIILFQRGRNLERLHNIARNNLKLKTKYNGNEILMHKYSIDDFWGEVRRDIKQKNYFAFGIDSNLLISNIVELFLKLNGGFLRQPNEMITTLKKIDKAFANRIEGFYKEKTLQEKQRILSGLVKYIYKQSNGPLPTSWILKK